ncbi:hypothetical protein K438DRAFT_1573302 [Mycena galopus ATCC 62051]|nr:hypothetical protein K438DRAFT_1573302 [Mycena galopus ATCC 62051]
MNTWHQWQDVSNSRKTCQTRFVSWNIPWACYNCQCQLKYLETYVEGIGIEDLEGCEHFFSKSNGLSRSVQYASVFHRKQTIRTYLAHMDTFDMSHHKGKCLR